MSIEIREGKENHSIIVYAMVMDTRVNLREFEPTDSAMQRRVEINAFKLGAESLVKALEEHQPSPEQVAEMAQEAARAAGVDESTIAQGGVAVGHFGAVSIPSGYEREDEDERVYE